MLSRTFTLAALLVTGCSPSEDAEHAAIMDKVERQVKLPPGAAPLSQYERYYAYSTNWDVLAEYVRGTNKREWVADRKSFPMISDGGCGVVTVRHNLRSGHSDAWCNGVA
jgi:hypothetical protein